MGGGAKMIQSKRQLADGRQIKIERRGMYSRRGNTLGQRVKITHRDESGARVASTYKVFGRVDERAEDIALQNWFAEYPMQAEKRWEY
jgi:hypothetical protein